MIDKINEAIEILWTIDPDIAKYKIVCSYDAFYHVRDEVRRDGNTPVPTQIDTEVCKMTMDIDNNLYGEQFAIVWNGARG